METALNVAILILSVVLILLVVSQARTPGMAGRDAGALQRTRRGLEKTMHEATIVIAVLFLVLSLIASLPFFGAGTAL